MFSIPPSASSSQLRDRKSLKKQLPHYAIGSTQRGFEPSSMCSEIPSDELHRQLYDLLERARSHPPRSLMRRKYLGQLIRLVQQSNRLYRGNGAKPEHYQEALSMTWAYVIRHLDKYDPSRSEVLTWINYRLKFDIKTVQIKASKEAKRKQTWLWDNGEDNPTSPIDRLPAGQDAGWVITEFQAWLHNSAGQLVQIHVRGRKDLNCTQMIQWHLLDGETFQQIAARVNAPQSTLSSFWYKKCVPQLQQFHDNLSSL